MGKRTYEEYIKNGCHPVGYNEPCQSYYFGQVSVDWLLDQIDQLKRQLAEKEKRIETFKKQLKNAIVMPFILPTYYLCGEWHTKILLGFDNYSSPKMEYFHNKEKDKVIKQAEQKLKELLKGEKDVKD